MTYNQWFQAFFLNNYDEISKDILVDALVISELCFQKTYEMTVISICSFNKIVSFSNATSMQSHGMHVTVSLLSK